MIGDGYVLVTGCSSGIGLATAHGLCAAGTKVIASARTKEQVDRLKSEGFEAVLMDVSSRESISNGFAEAVSIAGVCGVRGLFSNAGYGQPGAIEDVSWDGMEEQLRTNVLGTHEVVRLATKEMRRLGGGRILICSSILGVVGMKMRGIYCTSKYALEGFSDVLRMELSGGGIEVVLIEPGPVLTRFRANGYKAFKKHVSVEGSAHERMYAGLEKKLLTEGPVAPFTVSAEGCAKVVVKAMTCKRPRARYRVTVQTRVFTTLKRILSTRMMDRIASRG